MEKNFEKNDLANDGFDTQPKVIESFEVEGENAFGSGYAADGVDDVSQFVDDCDSDEGEDTTGLIRVKFNKKRLKFTSDEAVPFVEMGLKWNSFKEDYQKLAMLSDSHNYSVRGLIDKLVSSNESLLFNDILTKCEGNEVAARQVFAQVLMENSARYETESGLLGHRSSAVQKEDIKKRLMAEFSELNEMVSGEFRSFDQVPLEVVNDAIQGTRSLVDSYLRFSFRELGSIKSALSKQLEIKNRSSGSLKSERAQAAELVSFEKAFRSALK